MLLAIVSPAAAQHEAMDDSTFAQAVESLRWAIPSLGAQRIHATADSMVRAFERQGTGESARAYTARELLVEASQFLRHRPDPETCALAERTLRFRVRTATADSAGVARSLQLAARCAHRSGDVNRALGYHRRAAAILTQVRGPESYELSVQLNNFAAVLSDAGLFRNMRDTLERALAVRLRHRPPHDPAVLLIKNNLAVVHEAEGDAIAARLLYEEVLAGYEKSLGSKHPKRGYALHNLAGTMVTTGEAHRALALYEHSLAVRESTAIATRVWFEVGETLTSMSELLLDLNQFARARPLLERALEIQTRELRADHPYRIRVLLGLAAAHRAAGDLDGARRRSRDALAALDSAGATDHPDRAKALVSLGETELAAGRPAAAIAHLQPAVTVNQNSLGADHPRTARAMRLLSEAMARAGERGALAMALDAEHRQRDHLRRSIRALSERQAFAVRGTMSPGLDVALSCLASSPGNPDSLRASAWDALIRARGMLLDEIASRIQMT
jgi:tetratricopeptide (TPR) repeat protein